MAGPYTNTESGDRRALLRREDSDGTIHVYARAAHATVTAQSMFVIKANSTGYVTAAVFDTTFASTTAASHQHYYVGVAEDTYSSDTDGWFQIGGYQASANTATQSGTLGAMLRWKAATFQTSGASDTAFCADFGVFVSSASDSTAHEIFLLAREVCGIT